MKTATIFRSHIMTLAQKDALKALSDALALATDSGLFDSAPAWDAIGPDTINAFCDSVALLEAQ